MKELREVEFESTGVNNYTVVLAEESVRKTILAKLIEADCVTLEVTAVKSSLEDVFVKLTAQPRAQTREEALDSLAEELEAERAAEDAAAGKKED